MNLVISHPIVRLLLVQVPEIGLNGTTGHSLAVEVAFLNENLELQVTRWEVSNCVLFFQMVISSLPALVIKFTRHLCIMKLS